MEHNDVEILMNELKDLRAEMREITKIINALSNDIVESKVKQDQKIEWLEQRDKIHHHDITNLKIGSMDVANRLDKLEKPKKFYDDLKLNAIKALVLIVLTSTFSAYVTHTIDQVKLYTSDNKQSSELQSIDKN